MAEPTRDYQPYLSLGGTPPGHLLDANSHAHYRLLLALDALADTGPNGRDYPEHGRYVAACAEYRRRTDLVRALLADLQADGDYYCEVVMEREEARR